MTRENEETSVDEEEAVVETADGSGERYESLAANKSGETDGDEGE